MTLPRSSSPVRRGILALAIAASAFGLAQRTNAQTSLYWDANGAGGGTGGTGTWDLTSELWRLGGTGGTLQTWDNTSGNVYARFPTTVGTVTIADGLTINANRIYADTGGYRILGGPGSTLNFDGVSPLVSGNNNGNLLSIGTNVTGASLLVNVIDLTVSGNMALSGTFTNTSASSSATLFTGNNSFGTGIDLTTGRLAVSSSQNLGGDSSPLTLRNSGATLSILGTELTSFGSRAVTFNSGVGGGLIFDIQDRNNTFTLDRVNNNSFNSSGATTFAKTGQGTLDVTVAQGWNNSNAVGIGTAFNGGTLRINSAAGGSLNSANKLAFGGGTLELLGSAAGGSVQTFGNIRLNAGGGEIVVNNNDGTGTTTLNLGNFTLAAAANGSSLDIRTTNLGSGSAVITTTQANDASGIIGAGRIIYSGAAVTGNTVGFATNTGSQIDAYTGATPFVGSGADGTVNYLLSGAGAVSASEAVNTLKITSTAAAQSLTIDADQTLTINTGGLLFTGADDYAITGGTINSDTAGNSDLIIHQYGDGTLTLGSVVANGIGTSVLTKAGSGTLILTGANTYTGGTFVNGGVLSIGAANNLGTGPTTNALTLNNGTLQTTATISLGRNVSLGGGGGTFDVADGTTLTVGNTVSGNGLILNNGGSGSGILNLNASNSFVGGVHIESGILLLSNNGALNAKGYNTLSFGAGDTATVRINGAREIGVAGLNTDNTSAIVENGAVGAALLRVNNGWDNTFAGQLQDGAAGTLGLIKDGAGNLVLTGNNTYTGATSVNAGTLIVNGSLGDTAVTVHSDAALGGSGTIAGSAAILAGGLLTPGNSPGVLTIEQNLTLETDSAFTFELFADSTAGRGTNFDGVDTGLSLTIQSGVTSNLIFNETESTVDFTTTFWDSDQSWLVFENDGSLSLASGGVFDSISISTDSQGNSFAVTGGALNWVVVGNDVYLNYTAIPEPTTGLLFGLGIAALALRRRTRG